MHFNDIFIPCEVINPYILDKIIDLKHAKTMYSFIIVFNRFLDDKDITKIKACFLTKCKIMNEEYFKYPNGWIHGEHIERDITLPIHHMNMIRKTNYVNGVKHGRCSEYYWDGGLYSSCNYVNGQIDGIWIRYWANETPREAIRYKNGKQHGSHLGYNPDGRPYYKNEYVNGILSGESNNFYKNGLLMINHMYHRGLKHGYELRYRTNGVLIYSASYVNGYKEGPAFQYYPNGKVKSVSYYRNGIKSRR